MPNGQATGNMIQIKLVRSPIGRRQDQKDTVRALGLRKLNQTVECEDTPVVRGMVNKVAHLVEVTGVEVAE